MRTTLARKPARADRRAPQLVFLRSAYAFGLSVVLQGCSPVAAPESSLTSRPNVRAWVTDAMADSLDADGHFVFPAPDGADGWMPASPAAASAVAAAFVATFLSSGSAVANSSGSSTLEITDLRQAIALIHGRPVDWGKVRVTTWPAYYAMSPAKPPADTVPAYVRRAIGPRFHVLLTERGLFVADIAVSSDLSGVALTSGSPALLTRLPSETVHAEGLPAGLNAEVPLLPEVAVADVARRTGAKVDAVPMLYAPWHHLSAVFARWMLHFDREIHVEQLGTGKRIASRQLLVGLGPSAGGGFALSWFVADGDQPARDAWPFVWPRTGQRDSIEVRFVPFRPVSVFQVRLVTVQ